MAISGHNSGDGYEYDYSDGYCHGHWLKRLFVSPEARGLGLGPRLVAAAIESVDVLGGSPAAIWLETVAGVMDPAIAIYRRHGFRVVEATTSTIDGVPAVITMRRDPVVPVAALTG